MNELKISYHKTLQQAKESAKASQESSQYAHEAAQAAREMKAECETLRDAIIGKLILGQLAYTYIIELGRLALGDRFDETDPPTNWQDLRALAAHFKKEAALEEVCKPFSLLDVSRAVNDLLEGRVPVAHPVNDPRTSSPVNEEDVRALIESSTLNKAQKTRAFAVLNRVSTMRNGDTLFVRA